MKIKTIIKNMEEEVLREYDNILYTPTDTLFVNNKSYSEWYLKDVLYENCIYRTIILIPYYKEIEDDL